MALTAFLCSADSSVGEDNKQDLKYLKMSKTSTQASSSPLTESKKTKNNPFRRKPRGQRNEVQIIEHPNKGKKASKTRNGAGTKHPSIPQQSIATLKQNGSRFLKTHHPFKRNLKNKKELKEEVPNQGSTPLATSPCSPTSTDANSKSLSCQTSKLCYSVSCDSGNGDDLSSSCDSSVILDNGGALQKSSSLHLQQLDSIILMEEESSPEEEVFEDALSNISSDEEYVTPLSSRTPSLTCLTNCETATPSVTTTTPSDPTTTPSDPTAPSSDPTATPSDPTATPFITAITPPNSPISTPFKESPTIMPTDHPCIITPPINPTVATPLDKLPTTKPDDSYIATPTSSNAAPPTTSNIQVHDVHNDSMSTLDSYNDTLMEEESFTTSQDNTLLEQPDGDNNADTTSPNNKEVLFHIDDNEQPGSSPSNPGKSPGNSGHSIQRSLSVSTDNHILPSPKSLDSTRKPITISTRSLSYPAAISNGDGTNDGPRLLPCCDRHPLCYNWVLWFDKLTTGRPQFADYASQLQNVSSISSVESFWSVMNNLLPPSQLPRNANYHFFKEGVKPLWEDSANKKGGKWVITFKTNNNSNTLLDKVWLEVLMALIGEQIQNSHLITGIVMSRRKKGDRIAIWTANNNKSTNLLICKQLLAVIGLACDTPNFGQFISNLAADRGGFNMVYMLHKDSLRTGTSYQNEAHLTLREHLQFMLGKTAKN